MLTLSGKITIYGESMDSVSRICRIVLHMKDIKERMSNLSESSSASVQLKREQAIIKYVSTRNEDVSSNLVSYY